MDIPIPVDRIPIHQGTDSLLHPERWSAAIGAIPSHVEPGPRPGASVGYWGPDIKTGIPQPALNVDMDAFTNVESLSFSFNSQAASLPIVFISEQFTHTPIPIPIPNISPLNPPLGVIPPIPLKFNIMEGTAKLTPIGAAAAGMAEASKTADAVTATGSLDVLRYGQMLQARSLVGVRGTGPAFEGLYYVKSVTHKIKRGEFTEDFVLTRNGLLSTVPRVPA